MLESARVWYERCQSNLFTGKLDNPMYVDFPGFEDAFQCSLDLSGAWEVAIDEPLDRALLLLPEERFEAVLKLYENGVETLTNDYRPDVVACCLSPEVVRQCRTVGRSTLTREQRRRVEKRHQRSDSAQLSFQWESEEPKEELLYRDFRRALKARVMAFKTPIQIVTNNLLVDARAKQDPATRAWNSSVALFYKGGGIPWRIKSEGPETCFIGISFHFLRTTERSLMYSSLAQAFSSEGDGFALRGEAVPWSPDQSRNPHLDAGQAERLAGDVLNEYQERTGQLPARVVLHKTTQFDDRERAGFLKALRQIAVAEFVNIAASDFRLVQRGAYPPKRGTMCRINGGTTYLFTTGFIPEWQTYPGMHVPVPVEIITEEGTDVIRVATEVLALARMNWNTAFDTTGAPITLRFARQVGGIMAEVRGVPHPSYRFYM
jgi:hypothetical protein